MIQNSDLREETNSKVRGIIVSHNFDRRLVNATTEVLHIKLKKYTMQFNFEEING